MDQRGKRKISINYVVDASVVAKWILTIEVYQENANRLMQAQASEAVNLFAPSILTLELTNTLWKAIKLKRLAEEKCREALKSLEDSSIAIYEIDWHQAPDVLRIARELDITVYDASYVFLSEKLGIQLITSDNRLYEKAKTKFKLLHLKDYF